ncbi:hypothetical protein [Roseococcus sp.]|uniref:hypothetical protein n=1 Tax=Roseococcus sp. TaxID=2109646 RepID=UPI003BACFFA9
MKSLATMLLGPEWFCYALAPRIEPPPGVQFQTPVFAFTTAWERNAAAGRNYKPSIQRTHALHVASGPIRARTKEAAAERFAFEVMDIPAEQRVA